MEYELFLDVNKHYGKSKPFYRLPLVWGFSGKSVEHIFLCESICVISSNKVMSATLEIKAGSITSTYREDVWCTVLYQMPIVDYKIRQNNTKALFSLECEQCVNIRVSLCVFLCCAGFNTGQPGFLSLWHTQQSFLLNAMGGVDDAAQWLPSGHYEDQLYEVELQSLASLNNGGYVGTRESSGSLQQQEHRGGYSLQG